MINSEKLTLGCLIQVDGQNYRVDSLPLPKEISDKAEGILITPEFLKNLGYESNSDSLSEEYTLELPSKNFANIFRFKDDEDWTLHIDDKYRMSLGGGSRLVYYHEIQSLLSILEK